MRRNTNARFIKPMLEQLEERAQPSFLLGTNAVPQLAAPLNNMVKDMQSAATDLKAQFTLIQNKTAPANTFAGAEITANKMISDWQRILTDSAAIKGVSSAEVSFINTVAFSEAVSGDVTDLLVLNFGGIFGLHPLNPLTDPVTQANGIVNDPVLNNPTTGIVNLNLHALNSFVDSTTPISQETFAPTF